MFSTHSQLVCRSGVRAILLALFAAAGIASTAPSHAAEPASNAIREIVRKHFQSNPEYRTGDLICRTEVEPIIDELITMGIKNPQDVEDLYDAFLMPNDYVVRTLHSPQGRQFMRKVSTLPGVYDRLERLSWTAAGREILDQLVASSEGPQKFQALLTPEGMENLAKKLANDPRGRNFHLPTGHVQTEAQLLEHLQRKLSPSQTR